MNLALCYESVIPSRGGCEVYLADLIRRLAADRHELHLYACARDAAALPGSVTFHALMPIGGPRFLRPWRFARACARALVHENHDVVLGFVKTWRQDVILPQGGLHAASAEGNIRKHRQPMKRIMARAARWLDPAHWSYLLLERRQYLAHRPLIVAASRVVQESFQRFYGIGSERIRVIHNAVDPQRFSERDRLKLRADTREELGIEPDEPAALFVGHNYRLKGLEPLLYSLRHLPEGGPFRLLVCGGARTRYWQRLAARIGVLHRVSFLGYRSPMRAYFFAADFLVHPTFYDPCSLVVLEALACGMPVITSRYNGACERLRHGQDGFILSDPHDIQTLAGYIQRLCNPTVRAGFSLAARQAGAAWTFEDHYQALLQVLAEAARQKQAA